MITEVELKVTLQLDYDDPQPADKIKLAAKQAVSNALQFAYDNGFEHDLADDASIGVADVEVMGAIITNKVKQSYENGECPDCGEDIPDDIVNGDKCANCGHVFYEYVPEDCDRCRSKLNSEGKCTDVTCPFSDHKQNCPAGWNGHPEHKAGRCTCKGKP